MNSDENCRAAFELIDSPGSANPGVSRLIDMISSSSMVRGGQLGEIGNTNGRRKQSKPKSDEQFGIDLKKLIKKGLIQPAVNGLKYVDVEGKCHRASVLPNGGIQANCAGGQTYRSLRTWMASFVDLGPNQTKSWEFEMKRVRFKDIPMWRLFYQSKLMEPINPQLRNAFEAKLAKPTV